MVSRFLLLMALSGCVCGTFVVNVAHTSYQAEVNQDVTLEWTFTNNPDNSSKSLFIVCDMFTDHRYSVLIDLQEGVEVSQSQDKEFAGRVHFDKDILREGRIGLHVSSLRTEDSGWYRCEVFSSYGVSLDKCRLTVIERNQTINETTEPEGPGRTSLYIGLGLTAAALLLVFVMFLIYRKVLTQSPEVF